MRVRTTWNTQEILNRTAASTPTAATNRTADPYAMNQDHIKQQPQADKYLTGDPSAFAEDITTPNNWQVEYSGGAVKRNEIGEPEVRPDTFSHPEKTASQNHDLLLKKADITVRIARRMLGANAPEVAIEEQAASLMHLPDAEVINTYNRLAGEMPPALKEHMEQKQQAGEKESEEQVQEQAKQAAIRGDKTAFDAAVAKLVTLRQANGQQQGQPMQQQGQAQQQQAQGQQQAPAQQQAGQQQQSQMQDQSAWYDSKGQRPGHSGPDNGPYAGQQQQAQGQPQMPAPQQQQAQGQPPMMPPQQQGGQEQFPGGQFPHQAQGQPQQGVEAQVQQMIEQAAQQMQASRRANDPQQQAPAQQQAGQQQQAQGQQQAPAQQQAGQQQQAQGQQGQPMQQQGAGYQQAQGQPQQAPAQQQAGQQQQAMGYQQQQAQGLVNPNQGISPNYAGQQQVQASDDQLIDQMLMPSGGGQAPAPSAPIAEMDIQMDAPNMDIGDVTFQPGEDDMLRQLFSNDEAMAAQQAQEAQQGQGQQQVQASNVRTAALRTVGTRPSAGVARIGGAGAPPARGQEVDKLTSLWQSAPDVREVFGLKT